MQYGGFRKHVKEAHSMWNYIYFALYLDYRDRNDHNALEKYIFEAVSIICAWCKHALAIDNACMFTICFVDA